MVKLFHKGIGNVKGLNDYFMNTNISRIWFVLIILFASGCKDSSVDDMDSKAFNTLLNTLDNSDRWVGIHAAESLIDLGHKEKIKDYFLQKLKNYADTPQYRIGIWRVLAKVSAENDDKQKWINHIIQVYRDTSQSDRLHASESLAKLNVNLSVVAKDQSEIDLIKGSVRMKAYVTWGRSVSGNPDSVNIDRLLSMLYSTDESVKRIGAYALGFLSSVPAEEWNNIAKLAMEELSGSISKVYLLKAAYLTVPDSLKETPILSEIKQNLISAGMSQQKADRYQLCFALAEQGKEEDITLLSDILNGKNQLTENLPGSGTLNNTTNVYDHPWNVDIRGAAAYAILKIHQKVEKKISVFDWFVIMAYMLGMVVIGLHYSRKIKSKDDYLLGGRSMPPFLVGLSLFATLMSAISYLAYPGEMIQYGFVWFAGVLAMPLIYFIVGWFLIPKFMKLNITNAYEILELKIGRGVRILGTFFFLSLRMLWMATIIHIIVTIVFQTIFVIDPKYVPLLSVLLAVVTILYTSLGGLRAVVFTDSVQTLIMLFGAIIVIALVGFSLGSIFEIFPSTYPVHWQELDWSIDPQKRMTVGNILIFYLLWFICTAGSDQMAVQRYLGTKDIRTARKSFGINLITNAASKILLGLVGLALLAYFTSYPYKLPEGHSAIGHADSLFPRFILIGLPIGITGLIVSALLAAGMSSLSSGLISSTTIISGDLIEYFNNKIAPVKNKSFVKFIKNPRNISIILGILITTFSLFVGYVEGNVLAITMKVVNLFVAPLFVLFFMALFIPFATQTATLIAGISSVAVAISIAFFEVFGVQFLWIIPFSLLTGIVIGVLLSAIETYICNKKN